MRIAVVLLSSIVLTSVSHSSESLFKEASSTVTSGFKFEGGERVRIDVENQNIPLEQIVTTDGYVSVPAGGTVNIAGLNLQQASELLATAVENQSGYRKPKVSIAIVQQKIRKAYIEGEVTRPQAIELPSDHKLTLAAALAIAEGPTPDADITRIKVVHPLDAAKIEIVNAAKFESPDQEDLGPALRAGDVVIVPRAPTFSISGEIAQPGVLSRKHLRNAPGEPMRLSQAIAASGGAKACANLRSVILVRTQNKERQSTTYNLDAALENHDLSQDPALQDGDQIVVPTCAGYTILGKVKTPGCYYAKPMTLSKLIAMAGGLEQFAKKSGIMVARKDGPVRVDIGEITKEGRLDRDVILNPGDIVYVGENML